MIAPDAFGALLAPIAGDDPAGRDVRHEGDYARIAEARRDENAALPQGVWARDVKQADWAAVERLCTATLTDRSKDLRVACWLGEAWVQRHGFTGLAPALSLIDELIGRFWDVLHPKLDDGDPGARVAAVAWLDQRLPVLLRLVPMSAGDEAPLSWSTRMEGERLELVRARDEAAARKAEAGGAVTLAQAEAAFARVPRARLEEVARSLRAGLDALARLDATLDATCGREAPGLSRIRGVASDIADHAEALLAHRDRASAQVAMAPAPPAVAVPSPPAAAATTRADAYAQLARVAAFLHLHDPHSPVPAVLDQLARWEEMSLAEIDAELRAGAGGIALLLDALGLLQQEASDMEVMMRR